MVLWTSGCRTTSDSSKKTNRMPDSAATTVCASMSPEVRPGGRSTCVTSPVMTAFELFPRRVRNIFICSDVVFWASSRITKELLSVRPRMKARGAIEIAPLRSEEHTSELQSRLHLVCRLLLEKKKKTRTAHSCAVH